eukprot:4941824-Alexandrium_andersonii.AAC.1
MLDGARLHHAERHAREWMHLQLHDFLHAPPWHGDLGTPCAFTRSLIAQGKLVAMWSLPAD